MQLNGGTGYKFQRDGSPLYGRHLAPVVVPLIDISPFIDLFFTFYAIAITLIIGTLITLPVDAFVNAVKPTHSVTIDYLHGASFLLICTTQRMFPLGLCQYLEDRYVFSLGPRCFSFAPFPEDAPTPVPLLLFAS